MFVVLDGHTSHTSADRLLELAANNDIVLFCLPSSTHFLQTLDRCFFKSLKHFWHEACQQWISNHPSRTIITRAQFGDILKPAWKESATSHNGAVSFEATGKFPFNPKAIPSRAFVGSNENPELQQQFFKERATSRPRPTTAKAPTLNLPQQQQSLDCPQPSTSQQSNRLFVSSLDYLEDRNNSSTAPVANLQPTPTKTLQDMSPVPIYDKRKPSKRRQEAQELTSPEDIAEKKAGEEGEEGNCVW